MQNNLYYTWGGEYWQSKNEAIPVFSTFYGLQKIVKILERNGIQLVENLQYIESITSEISALQGARFEPIKNKMVSTL